MAEKKWFIPAAGGTVRDPATREIVPAEGKEVEDTIYWRRLVDAENGTYGDKPGEKSRSVKKDGANA